MIPKDQFQMTAPPKPSSRALMQQEEGEQKLLLYDFHKITLGLLGSPADMKRIKQAHLESLALIKEFDPVYTNQALLPKELKEKIQQIAEQVKEPLQRVRVFEPLKDGKERELEYFPFRRHLSHGRWEVIDEIPTKLAIDRGLQEAEDFLSGKEPSRQIAAGRRTELLPEAKNAVELLPQDPITIIENQTWMAGDKQLFCRMRIDPAAQCRMLDIPELDKLDPLQRHYVLQGEAGAVLDDEIDKGGKRLPAMRRIDTTTGMTDYVAYHKNGKFDDPAPGVPATQTFDESGFLNNAVSFSQNGSHHLTLSEREAFMRTHPVLHAMSYEKDGNAISVTLALWKEDHFTTISKGQDLIRAGKLDDATLRDILERDGAWPVAVHNEPGQTVIQRPALPSPTY